MSMFNREGLKAEADAIGYWKSKVVTSDETKTAAVKCPRVNR